MDHLPHPSNAALPPLTIPYFKKYKFDKGSFAGYPSRCGFDKSNFQWGEFSSIPWEDHDAFFQAWLYFGLIYDFFGADDETFIDRENKRITTANLPHVASKWQQRLPKFSRKDRLAEYERVQTSLREACDAVSFLDSATRRERRQSNLSEEIAYSIVVLGLALEETKVYHNGLSRSGGMSNQDLLATQVGSWPTTELARKRLEAAGWCKSESARLETYFMATGQFYCASMETSGLQVDHSKCTERRCAAEDIDESTYVTAHDDACHEKSSCEHVGLEIRDIESIIEAGNYPVIALSAAKDGSSIEMKAVPYHKSIHYTAISHVWKDGMGNPNANTLPRCQVERLCGLLTSLQEAASDWSSVKNIFKRSSKKAPVFFWNDTLAIPLRQDLRKKAIKLMYQVYKNAYNVLVLDRTMLHFSSDDRPLEELCFRLSASAWMRRAWTLQEGALAKNLYVQFRDKAINVADAAESLTRKVMRSDPTNMVLEESCSAIRYILDSGQAEEENQLTSVLRGLRSRSTSHEEDKEICLAVMLRLNMDPIMDAKGDRRTQTIYRELSYIPDGLFWHKQPSFDIPGLRWSPKNIFDCSIGVAEYGLRLTEQGLMVTASGFLLRARTHYLDRWGPHVRDPTTGKWYNFRWLERESFDGSRVKSNATWTVLAIILRAATMLHPIREGVVIRLAQTVSSPAISEVQQIASGNDILTGEFMGRVVFEELDPATTDRLVARTEKNKKGFDEFRRLVRTGEEQIEDCDEATRWVVEEEGDDSWYVFDGIMCHSKQKWCVT